MQYFGGCPRNPANVGGGGGEAVNKAMRGAVRCTLVVVAVLTMAAAGSGTASFAAVAPANGVFAGAEVSPTTGEVVGVGEPVTVSFPRSIADRSAVERAITVTSPRGKAGRFQWTNDHVVQWIPSEYWPAHAHVSMLVGGEPLDIQTGAATLGVASISQHTFTVSIDGQVAREMPASMGKPSRPTPVGSFTVLDRNRSVIMDSRTIGIPLSSPEGYRITAYFAERINSGGVYVHSAPWSVDSQGHANVSHGCINLSPENAEWYYNIVHVGDPVIVNA